MTERRTRWEIRDAAGEHLATHVRIDREDGGKDVVWVHPDGQKVSRESPLPLPLIDMPLYGVHSIEKSPMVVVTEGEKAADALRAVDVTAVGTVTGASVIPSPRALADLAGRHVVLWPDADQVGETHMLGIAKGLSGVASSVRWIIWPEAPDHGDAADYLTGPDGQPTGADPWDLIDAAQEPPSMEVTFQRRGLGYTARFPDGRVEMSVDRIKVSGGETKGEIIVRSDHPAAKGDGHLVQATFNVSSDVARDRMAKALQARAPGLKSVPWRDYLEVFCRKVLAAEREGQPIVLAGGPVGERPTGIVYDIWPLLPRRRSTILFAAPGTGKSYLAAAAVVAYSTGAPAVPGWKVDRQGRALVLDWEDDRDTWDERIAQIANGLQIEPPRYFYSHPLTSLTDEADRLARFCDEQEVGLVIVDSFGMASPASREGGDANEAVLRLFRAVNVIGRTTLIIDHVTKEDSGGGGRAKGPYGSIYKTALARQTWELQRKDEGDGEAPVGHLALYDAKRNNNGRRAPLGLKIEYGDGFVRFDREDVFADDSPFRGDLPLSERVERLLARGALTRREITEELDANVGTMGNTLSRLIDRKRIVRLPDGQRFALMQHEEGTR